MNKKLHFMNWLKKQLYIVFNQMIQINYFFFVKSGTSTQMTLLMSKLYENVQVTFNTLYSLKYQGSEYCKLSGKIIRLIYREFFLRISDLFCCLRDVIWLCSDNNCLKIKVKFKEMKNNFWHNSTNIISRIKRFLSKILYKV